MYDFIKFETIQAFRDATRIGMFTMDMTNDE